MGTSKDESPSLSKIPFSEIEVSQLKLNQGKKRKNVLQTPIKRKVQIPKKGYAVIQLPTKIVEQLNIILNAKLYVEYSDVNILSSEIKIRLFNTRPSQKQSKQ